MATVQSRTKISIDELVNDTVTGGLINSSGRLILTTRGGAAIDAGPVTKSVGGRWSPTVTYSTGEVVGYLGRLWLATGTSLAKLPAYYNSLWTPLTSADPRAWNELDYGFNGDTPGNSYEFFWASGSPVVSYTSTAGEFETGRKALKISLAAGAYQRFYSREENFVRGGEWLETTIRAKLASPATALRLNVELYQNDAGEPAPFAGATAVAAPEGSSRQLTTSWADYQYTVQAGNGKPRANIQVTADPGAGAGAVVLIDRIRTKRYDSIFEIDTPWIPAQLINSWVNYDSGLAYGGAGRIVEYRRYKGVVYIRGVCRSGTGVAFVLPQYFRPATKGVYEYSVPVGSSGAIGQVNLDASTGQVSLAGAGASTYCYLAGMTPYIAEG